MARVYTDCIVAGLRRRWDGMMHACNGVNEGVNDGVNDGV